MKIIKIVCGLALTTTLLSSMPLKAEAHQPLGVVNRRTEVKPEGK